MIFEVYYGFNDTLHSEIFNIIETDDTLNFSRLIGLEKQLEIDTTGSCGPFHKNSYDQLCS